MINYPKDLANWPLNLIGWPILTSTNEAFLYAQLIYNDPDKQAHLVRYRQETYAELRRERDKKDPDLQHMMDLAVTAQFFREAFMECLRIQDENSNPTGG